MCKHAVTITANREKRKKKNVIKSLNDFKKKNLTLIIFCKNENSLTAL